MDVINVGLYPEISAVPFPWETVTGPDASQGDNKAVCPICSSQDSKSSEAVTSAQSRLKTSKGTTDLMVLNLVRLKASVTLRIWYMRLSGLSAGTFPARKQWTVHAHSGHAYYLLSRNVDRYRN